ncbi:MAG: iron-sulfur cluster assembly accessory protein [Acidobacteria bacterium]|nr:MAG: iron-sulfur cluster assembly accessory protein [Acidobacteriota bacterium]
MVTLTEKASLKVKEVMNEQTESYSGVRIAVVGGGCSGFQYAMNLETEEREGDHVVQVDGFKVYVDADSLAYLNGTEIDFVETVQGAGFTFKNPNAKSTCGCGESFHA